MATVTAFIGVISFISVIALGILLLLPRYQLKRRQIVWAMVGSLAIFIVALTVLPDAPATKKRTVSEATTPKPVTTQSRFAASFPQLYTDFRERTQPCDKSIKVFKETIKRSSEFEQLADIEDAARDASNDCDEAAASAGHPVLDVTPQMKAALGGTLAVCDKVYAYRKSATGRYFNALEQVNVAPGSLTPLGLSRLVHDDNADFHYADTLMPQCEAGWQSAARKLGVSLTN